MIVMLPDSSIAVIVCIWSDSRFSLAVDYIEDDFELNHLIRSAYCYMYLLIANQICRWDDLSERIELNDVSIFLGNQFVAYIIDIVGPRSICCLNASATVVISMEIISVKGSAAAYVAVVPIAAVPEGVAKWCTVTFTSDRW